MLSIKSPYELASELGQRLKALRLQKGWTQANLAERSGINVHTLKRFEHTGQISLERLLCLAFVLGIMNEFDALMLKKMPLTIKELKQQSINRIRGKRRAKI